MYKDSDQWAAVRDRILRRGIPIKQVVRETGISRKTVRKMLQHASPPPYSRAQIYPRTGAYRSAIRCMLEREPESSPRPLTAVVRQLRAEQGYSGSYDAVRRYVAAIRSANTRIEISLARGTARFEGEPPAIGVRKHRLAYRLAEGDEAPRRAERTVRVSIRTDHRALAREEAFAWMQACSRGASVCDQTPPGDDAGSLAAEAPR